jgi:hypothetical protein
VVAGKLLVVELEKRAQAARNLAPYEALRMLEQKCE